MKRLFSTQISGGDALYTVTISSDVFPAACFSLSNSSPVAAGTQTIFFAGSSNADCGRPLNKPAPNEIYVKVNINVRDSLGRTNATAINVSMSHSEQYGFPVMDWVVTPLNVRNRGITKHWSLQINITNSKLDANLKTCPGNSLTARKLSSFAMVTQ